ncbi:hypothetical protein BMS3Abin04_00217 [bacterium BMS3Abin04]|nr:hypothetical protein BMS3Abin04_00217 [bacterium BMS3Abin04]
MLKTTKIFVYLFVVFSTYYGLEELGFKNTILADTKSHCCDNAQCNGEQCYLSSGWKNPENGCVTETSGTCKDCLDMYSEDNLCEGYKKSTYCWDNGVKYYGKAFAGPPGKPHGLETSWVNGNQESGNPHIYWDANPEPDVVHYEVWKKIDNQLSPDVDWFIKATTTTNSYTDYSETGWGFMGPPRDVYYKLKAVDNTNKKSDFSTTVSFLCDDNNFDKRSVSKDNRLHNISTKYALYANYPNPFNPTTTISYTIAVPTTVHLIIFDILGKEVSKLVNEKQNKGSYTVVFDAKNLPSGIYYYRLITNNFSETKSMLLIK